MSNNVYQRTNEMLSNNQSKVTKHRDGHALISAAPGSGKTTTLAHTIHCMFKDGFSDKDMLILMFGKDASEHFAEKLASLSAEYGYKGDIPTIRTYHSLCFRTLQALEKKGVIPPHKLITFEKARELAALKALRKSCDEKKFKELQGKSSKAADEFLSFVDYVKAELLPPDEAFDAFDIKKEFRFFVDAFDVFEEERKQKRVRYFSDLIYDLVLFLKANPIWAAWISNKKKFVIVDEYQDSNRAQSQLLDYIVGTEGNLIACGDVDQSIFTFAGADPSIMLNEFKMNYPKHTFYNLPQTYRYSSALADLSNNLIQNNKERFDSECVSAFDEGTKVFLRLSNNFGRDFIDLINEKIKEGYEYQDIAALVRVYSNAVKLELELIKSDIPYKITSDNTCLNSREFRGATAVFAKVAHEDMALEHKARLRLYQDILKFPALSIEAQVYEKALKKAEDMPNINFERFCQLLIDEKIHSYMRIKLLDLIKTFKQLSIKCNNPNTTASSILREYAKDTKLVDGIRYASITASSQEEAIDRYMAILEYIENDKTSAKDCYKSLSEMRYRVQSSSDSVKGIMISSVHKAKGLEWPVVYMPEVVQNVWPYEKKDVRTDYETERRLFYVGMTRGMKEVHLATVADGVMASILPGCKADWRVDDDSSYFLEELNFDALKVSDGKYKIYAQGKTYKGY